MTAIPFRIVKQPRAWWPVQIDGLNEDGSPVTFEMRFRFLILKVDAAAAFMRDVVEATTREVDPDVNLSALYAELVARIADDWAGVSLENGEPLRWDVPEGWRTDVDAQGMRKPLVAPNLLMLMNEGGMFRRIFDAWRACLAGERERHEGN